MALSSPDEKTRVLIVDDQPSVQGLIRHALSSDPSIEVVGVANDAYMARELIKKLDPDVLTLDVEMPRMSGLDFLERLMRLRPMPVVMFSSVTQQGSENAVRALSLGAVDVLPKPVSGITPEGLEKLVSRVKTAKRFKRGQAAAELPDREAPVEIARLQRWNGRIALIGASTGGVAAVETVLRRMPVDTPPIVISQHMPESFLVSFARRLDDILPQRVELAIDGKTLEQGHIYLAPGGAQHTGIRRAGRGYQTIGIAAPKRNGHIPSVDELFLSAEECAEDIVAVLLTGIGKDGANGMQALKRKGAHCIGQDEATSVVYGMPRAAAELGILDQQLPLPQIAQAICACCDSRRN
ncbi:protein-glutamate methylesterase/protein-glutamine glutaminase [Oceanicola sp. S124]|uniref:protein-glutamate methylesterase/protein-glutamine glutaminase n=1 Tax=Oceanicola sp. S124 TaxID=1042378 RepID=UPI00025579C9|nr:chemotaxis response regulator protein-glutamate methylesterase [Oceanicola sp. S124]